MQSSATGPFHGWQTEFRYATLCATLVLLTLFVAIRVEGPANAVSAMRLGGAIVLGVLLHRRGRAWALYLAFAAIAVYLGNVLAGRPGAFAAGAAGIRVLEAGAAYTILRALRIDPVGLRDVRALAFTGAVTIGLVPVAGGLAGGWLVHQFYATRVPAATVDWALGTAMGMLVLLPVMLAWSPERWDRLCQPDKMKGFLIFLALSLVATLLAIEYTASPFIVMSLPLMLVASMTPLLSTAIICGANIVMVTLLRSVPVDGLLPLVDTGLMEVLDSSELNVYSALVVMAPLTIGVLLADRARGEHRLAASRRQMQAVTDNVPALIGYIDGDGRYLFVNRVYQDWFGLNASAMVGKTPEEVFGADTAHEFAPFLAQAMRGETVRFERRIQGGRQLESSLVPDFEDGQLRGIFLMSSDITARKALEARLQEESERARDIAEHDDLTGLPNRRSLELRLASALAEAQASNAPMALLFMDLDGFKPINDRLGHDMGDRLLRMVADRLKASVRAADTVARVGGDEFVVVLGPIREATDAEDIANKLLQAIRVPFDVDGRELHVSITIGIALHPQDGADAATLMRQADAAMYRAKSLGRDRFSLSPASSSAPGNEGDAASSDDS